MAPHPLPALLGGIPVRPQGPPSWPVPDLEIQQALHEAWADGSWGKYHGGHCERLAQWMAEYHHVPHVLLCGSGTFAVELALRAIPVEPGDEVLLAGYDYPGNFFSVHALGAMPVLVDVDPKNWNLSLPALAQAVGPKTKAVIASHLHGGLVPMAELMSFAQEFHLRVIEDAAQCPGAVVAGRLAGTWGDVGILSFGGSKPLTAGRGGALLTRLGNLAQPAKTHLLRGNLVCPLSELQAAVLLPQWKKLDQANQRRATWVCQLGRLLESCPWFRLLENAPGDHRPGYYKVGFRLDADALGISRNLFIKALRAEGLPFDEGFSALNVGRSPRRFRAGSTLEEVTRAGESMVVLHHPFLLEGTPEEAMAGLQKVWNFRESLRKLTDDQVQ